MTSRCRETRSVSSRTPGLTSSSTSPPRSAASARTGRARAGTGTPTRRWGRTCSSRAASPASTSSSRWGRSARTRNSRRHRSRRTTSGTATRRRPTRPTAWRRRRCWSARRPTASSTASNAIYLLPVNLYGPGDNFDLERSHVIPALIRKMIEAQERGESTVVLWGDGSPTREFLYVEDCAEGIVLASQRYDGADPVNLGTGEEISIRDLAELVAELTGVRRRDRLGHVEAERPAAPAARRLPGRGVVRLPRAHSAARGDRAHRRVVPRRSAELRGRLALFLVFLRAHLLLEHREPLREDRVLLR